MKGLSLLPKSWQAFPIMVAVPGTDLSLIIDACIWKNITPFYSTDAKPWTDPPLHRLPPVMTRLTFLLTGWRLSDLSQHRRMNLTHEKRSQSLFFAHLFWQSDAVWVATEPPRFPPSMSTPLSKHHAEKNNQHFHWLRALRLLLLFMLFFYH